MDVARELEQVMLDRQKPMNAIIDRGNTPVQQFYRGETLLVTGGTGFLGKQLIEKLFRSCDIQKLILLLRPKKDKSIQDRLNFMLSDPVYDLLRQKKPDFANKIVPMEGDVADLGLGLSNKDRKTVTEEISIIFHMAATVRFDSPLREATLTNVRGTREILALAKECNKLKCFVYVSTAYTHATTSRVGSELKEMFYPCPVPPSAMIELAENVDQQKLENMTPHMIEDWPNTYTFTKAIAEEVVRLNADSLPICMVRPPLVPPAYYEPSPGWGDTSVVYGPAGVLVGVGLGVLHVFYTRLDRLLNFVPVDMVNNAVIAAAWDSTHNRKDDKELPIYSISSTKCGIVWEFMGKTVRADSFRRFCSPLAVWYCYLIETDSKFVYWLLIWVLHYIPAYILDVICYVLNIKIKEIPSFMKIYKKIYKMSLVYGHFLTNEWIFNDDNVTDMISRMSDEDKIIYNCDVNVIDYAEYLKVISIGLRKYIVKDGLKDSSKAYTRQKWYYYANIVFMTIYAYVLYCIVYYCFSIVKYIIGF